MNKTKKSVLFVVNTMGQAGAETALCALLRTMDTEKYEIDLLAIIPRGELYARVPESVRILNKKYSCGSVHTGAGKLATMRRVAGAALTHGNGFRYFGYFNAVRKEQKRTGKRRPDKLLWRLLSDGTKPPEKCYDCAIAYLEGAATYFVADHVQAKHKAAFIHINYLDAGYSAVTDCGCYDGMEKIFPIAEGVKKVFLSVYPQYADKTEVFHNLVESDRITALSRTEKGFDDGFDGVRLLTVGRLHLQKGYDVAIEACRILRERGYKVRWYVIGEGGERRNLEKQIEKNDLKDSFVLLGRKENPYPYFASCDLYVQATRFEGKSIAVSEAQILGCTVVASDIEGNREQIDDGADGILVPLTAENIADGLARLIDNPDLRRRLSAGALAKNQSFERDLALLDSLCGE